MAVINPEDLRRKAGGGNESAFSKLVELAENNSFSSFALGELYEMGGPKFPINLPNSLKCYYHGAMLGSDSSTLKIEKYAEMGNQDAIRFLRAIHAASDVDTKPPKDIILGEKKKASINQNTPEIFDDIEQVLEYRDYYNGLVKKASEKSRDFVTRRDRLNIRINEIKGEMNQLNEELSKDCTNPRSVSRMRLVKRYNALKEERSKLVIESKKSHEEYINQIKIRENNKEIADAYHSRYKELSSSSIKKSSFDKNQYDEKNVSCTPKKFIHTGTKNILFLDFGHNLQESYDPVYGSSLFNQYESLSLNGTSIDQFIQQNLLKERVGIYFSSPNMVKKWEPRLKKIQVNYFRNISLRIPYDDNKDIILMCDVLNDVRSAIGNTLIVKGIMFLDAGIYSSGEKFVECQPVVRMGSDYRSSWITYNNSKFEGKSQDNVLDDGLISFLMTNYVIQDSSCIQFLKQWNNYLESRLHILEVNKKNFFEISSASLVAATFCDDCSEDILERYECIPFLKTSNKNQVWFHGNVHEEHCRRAILLHLTKHYDNAVYKKYVTKTGDNNFKKEFDKFTRNGMKLYDLDDDSSDIPIIKTFDTRISAPYIEKIHPKSEIELLNREYVSKTNDKKIELEQKKSIEVTKILDTYTNTELIDQLVEFDNSLVIPEDEILREVNAQGLEVNESNMIACGDIIRKKIISDKRSQLIELKKNEVNNSLMRQYGTYYETYSNEKKNIIEAEKVNLLNEKSELCVHVYFDITDDEEININNIDGLNSLADSLNNLLRPAININYDGDEALIKRQIEGISYLSEGYVMNPYLSAFLFDPDLTYSSKIEGSKLNYVQLLNESQKDAVSKAVSSTGIFLIQGPPGTGKTQTIAEITTQLVNLGKKVLIASQNNKAVDNAFSRLPHIPDIRPVRIIKDQFRNEYSYENLTENLYRNISNSLEIKIHKNAEEHKYVEKSKEIIDRLTVMKDNIESVEDELGDLEQEIELQKIGCQESIIKLSEIHSKCIHAQEDYNSAQILSESIFTGKCGTYQKYSGSINELESFNIEDRELILRSIALSDENEVMDAIVDIEGDFDKVDPSLISTELLEEDSDIEYLSSSSLVSKLSSVFDDSSSLYHFYVRVLDSIKTSKQGIDSEIIFCKKILDKWMINEADAQKNVRMKEQEIEDQCNDSRYVRLTKIKNDFNREVKNCFDELDISEQWTDEVSAIDIIKDVISKVRKKLSDRRINLEGRISAYEKIVRYLTDKDVIFADRDRINKSILKYANVFGITCSKTYSRLKMAVDAGDFEPRLNELSIDVIILDEASKIPFSEMVPPILLGKSVILVGDHKQLPPVYSRINDYEMDSYDPEIVNPDFERMYEDLYTESFFGNLFEKTSNNSKSTLTIQYRMHPQIMDVVNTFYPESPLTFGGKILDKEHYMTIKGQFGYILKPDRHTLFIDCPGHESREFGTKSSYNNSEADVVCKLLDIINDNCKLDRDGNEIDYDSTIDNRLSVGVICPYRGQVNLINEYKKEFRSFNHSFEERFQVSTVDNFQGDERDIIIISMVRTKDCDWLSEYRRINVALSRARRLLIIVGNEGALSKIPVDINDGEITSTRFVYKEIIDKISFNAGHLCKQDIMGGIE